MKTTKEKILQEQLLEENSTVTKCSNDYPHGKQTI